mgnify:FL=1
MIFNTSASVATGSYGPVGVFLEAATLAASKSFCYVFKSYWNLFSLSCIFALRLWIVSSDSTDLKDVLFVDVSLLSVVDEVVLELLFCYCCVSVLTFESSSFSFFIKCPVFLL